jgi:hypothetical protein
MLDVNSLYINIPKSSLQIHSVKQPVFKTVTHKLNFQIAQLFFKFEMTSLNCLI